MKDEQNCRIPTPDNCANYPVKVRIEKPNIMKEAKRKVENLYKERSIQTVNQLPLQGEILTLLAEEEKDISWKATIFKMPRGVMGWARWGRPVDPKCNMDGCSSASTLGHLLSSCAKALDRFKFRHDSVLNHLLQTIIKSKNDQTTVYVDLNGQGSLLIPKMEFFL